ncbi:MULTISPECIES: PhzF family phenazine biosynthesis protein [Aminobacterium]|uniref:PhzF family phenazine biosynthesis protein n=1 Tax=Aminobacterium TaxID=81466 RepID=UPI0025795DF6|nr:PhzF family phenazine biosynthesis protein [Aminobacterium sp. UBA4987]
MKKYEFYIVDVFAEKKYSGNQLAVVLGAGDLSKEDMESITREMNYSETTFILNHSPVNGGYPARIFTPGGEVPFAGHPTLGTAAVIAREIAPGNPDFITLNLQVGPIPVMRKDHLYIMKQNQPEFGPVYPPEDLARVLSIDAKEIETGAPVQWVSTGLPTVIVPLKRREVLSRICINRNEYEDFIERMGKVAISIYCKEPIHRHNHLHVRVLTSCFGVEEDPATGSSGGCLAAYLVRHKVMGASVIEDVRVEQGYSLQRPSLLFLSASDQDGGKIDVHVGGSVIFVAKGELI